MEIVGQVVREHFGKGSKSEHEAVMLKSSDGDFVLRIQGGNPFSDPRLDRLVGKILRCRGFRAGYAFVMKDWDEVQGE